MVRFLPPGEIEHQSQGGVRRGAAVRAGVRKDGKVFMNINNLWNYPDLQWGHYMTPFSVSLGYINTVRIRLTDNDNYRVVCEQDQATQEK